jgi:hypothetical protein
VNADNFARGIARMESLFKQKLSEDDRRLYYRALAMLSDEQWQQVVEYAVANWRKNAVPLPGQLREWAGIEDETPAERGKQAVLPGMPMVGATPLAAAMETAKTTGTAPEQWWRRPFWPDETTKLVYEDVAATIGIPQCQLWGAEAVMSVCSQISERAEAKLAAYRRQKKESA